MSLKEERLQILKMLEEGKITADDAAKLLAALDMSVAKEQADATPSQLDNKAKWLRVHVTNQATGKRKVNVNLPISLVNVGLKMGAKFAPDLDETAMDEVIEAINSGKQGKIIEMDDEESGERVEIFVE